MTPASDARWYCVQAKQKAEHIALLHLEAAGYEAFLPRLRYQRQTVRGHEWVTEPVFPGYLFARFVWFDSYRHVRSMNGVSGIVQLGDTAPSIDPAVIESLKQQVGPEGVYTIDPAMPASTVFGQSLLTVEKEVVPGPLRVRLLLESLLGGS